MIRRKRKTRILKPVIGATVILIVLILFIYFINRLNILVVKKIEIKGSQNTCASADQIRDSSSLYGKNFFLLNEENITKDLKKKFICIKGIIFSRYFPDKIKLEIASREPVAELLSLREKPASASSLIESVATPEASLAGDIFIVDNEGVVFSKSQDDLNVPKIFVFDQKLLLGQKLDNITGGALKILEKIKTFGVVVKKSWVSENFFIINPDTKDPKVVFDLSRPIEVQLASLQLILTEAKINLRELEFIDLRFDKPIVRYASKENRGQR